MAKLPYTITICPDEPNPKQLTDKELMQQALDALEAMQSYAAAEKKGLRICDEAIKALRARLAQPEQEREE